MKQLTKFWSSNFSYFLNCGSKTNQYPFCYIEISTQKEIYNRAGLVIYILAPFLFLHRNHTTLLYENLTPLNL